MKYFSRSKKNSSYIRNFIFGVEDSVVSTVGLLSGIASAGVSRMTIILTGLILIFVEAVSMAAGSFLSEESVEEFEHQKKISRGGACAGSLIMFFSYVVAGMIPLFPYAFFEYSEAFWISIVLSLITLFFLGVISSRLTHASMMRSVVRMVCLGGLVIGVGVILGRFVLHI